MRESTNSKDPYAVAVMCRSAAACSRPLVLWHARLGHIPRKISAACVKRKGIIRCTVTASWRFSTDLPQGGLEVPCTLTFQSVEICAWVLQLTSCIYYWREFNLAIFLTICQTAKFKVLAKFSHYTLSRGRGRPFLLALSQTTKSGLE